MEEFINDSLSFLNVNGINPLRWNNTKIFVSLLLYLWIMIEIALEMLFNWKGMQSIEVVTDALAVWQVIFKILTLLINNEKFLKVLHKLHGFRLTNKTRTLQAKENVSYELLRKFVWILKTIYITLVMCYITKPVVTRKKILLLPSYSFSSNLYGDFVFGIIYAVQTVICCIATCSVIGFDTLFVTLIFYVSFKLRFIKNGFSAISIDPLNAKDENSIEEFKILVEHHSNILDFVKEINRCYSILLLNQFLTSIFCVCCSLLVLNSNDSGNTAKYAIYLTTYMGEIFIYCVAGSNIVTETESVAVALYEMQWWAKTQSELRQGIVLALLRSHKPAKLMGGGMFALDLPCFTTIVRTGLSFFTLIRTVSSNT